MEKTINLVLIRHGESEANASPAMRLQKNYNDFHVPLSDLGVIQAKICCETLISQQSDRRYKIYTSPMKRAEQTAEFIQSEMCDGVSKDFRLQEQFIPKFENEGERDMLRQQARQRGKYYYRYPKKNGESGRDVALRVESFLKDLLDDLKVSSKDIISLPDIVIVCHEVVMRAALFLLDDSSDERIFDDLDIKNGQSLIFSNVSLYHEFAISDSDFVSPSDPSLTSRWIF